jgi:hypothetical protein
MLRGGSEVDGHCDKCKRRLFHEQGIKDSKPWIGKWIHRDRKVCGICDVCGEPLKEEDGQVGKGENRVGWWIHNEANRTLCSVTAYNKSQAEKKAENLKKVLKEKEDALKEKAENKAVAMKNYKDIKKYRNATDKVISEMEIEDQRFEALSDDDQEFEKNPDFFPIPDPITYEQEAIISDEIVNRREYQKNQKAYTDKVITDLRNLMTDYNSTDRVLIVYSVASINKTNPSWKIPNPYSIEIHCTTFRPENNPNDPPQNFYGHVSLNIYRGIKAAGGINSEHYHYGIFNKDSKIDDFTRQFWSNDKLISKPKTRIFIDDGENSDLAFLFPTISAGDLMIQYYNWCIRTCPGNVMPLSLEKDTFKRLTLWGFENP